MEEEIETINADFSSLESGNLPGFGQFAAVPIGLLRESGLNHRKTLDPRGMAELTASIKENGIIENLVLRPVSTDLPPVIIGYQVICGNRRWQAAAAAGLTHVPATIRQISDEEALRIIIIENLQREDLHPLEEGEAYLELQRIYPDILVLAGKIGKKPPYVKLRLWMAEHLIDKAKELYRKEKMTLNHALAISRCTNPQQEEILKQLFDPNRAFPDEFVSIGRLNSYIDQQFHLNLADACFDTDDPDLSVAAGSCTVCPKRTGANDLLFPDITEKDICTDPTCFESKKSLHFARVAKTWQDAHPGVTLQRIYDDFGEAPKGTVGRGEFVIVKGKEAKVPEVRYGILEATRDRKNLGKIVAYIVPTPGQRKAANIPPSQRQSTLDSKKRELQGKQAVEEDMAAIQLLMPEMRKATLTSDELKAIARNVIALCGHDLLKRFCNVIIMAPVEKNKSGMQDFAGAVEKYADDAITTHASFATFLASLMLIRYVGSNRRLTMGRDQWKRPNLIYLWAQSHGVDFKEAFQPIAEKYKVREQRAAARLGLAPAPTTVVGNGGKKPAKAKPTATEKVKEAKAKAAQKKAKKRK